MKLIELLARELKEWPEGVGAIAQDIGGHAHPYKSSNLVFDGSQWEGVTHNDQVMGASYSVVMPDVADDFATAIITREQWEAATQPTAPTLETMVTEWRDLNARAQAAQAEADALFEHAGQCHGEIVVRLAELGWGASVVTLDDSDGWIEWKGGKCPLPSHTRVDVKIEDGIVYENGKGGAADHWEWVHSNVGCNLVAYRLSRPSTPQ